MYSMIPILKYNYCKLLGEQKLYVTFLLNFFLTHYYLQGIVQTAKITGHDISFAIFTFLWSNTYYSLIVLLGLIFLLCEAPFIAPNQRYVVIRSGKTTFFKAQILYVISSATLYFIGVVLLSFVAMGNHIYFSKEWGKLVHTLVRNGMHAAPLGMSTYLVTMTPLQALLRSLAVAIGSGSVLGLILLFLSMYSKKIGIIISVILIATGFLFNQGAIFSLPIQWIPISPVAMANLENLALSNKGMLNFGAYLLVGVSLLSLGILFCAKHVDI